MTVAYVGDRTKEKVGPQTVIRHDSENGDTILDLRPSQKLFNHSPDGFQWGYGGSGPAQLALAILLDVTGDEEFSVRWHQIFKSEKIAGLEDRFILIQSEVQDWVKARPTKVH